MRIEKYIHYLGGEAQRIAFCKLLLKKPKIVLCDEPTGSLDETNTKMMMNLLLEYHHNGATVVIVTRSRYANLCERVIHILINNRQYSTFSILPF